MKLKFLATIIGVGVLTAASAQSPTLELLVTGESSRTLTLDSFNFANGVLTVEATSSGGGDPEPVEPVLVPRTLTVTQPSNGQIVFHTTTTSFGTAGQPVPATVDASHMSNVSAPTIPLRLEPASGYQIGSWSGAPCHGSTSQTCSATMSSNRNITANFTLIPDSGSCGAAPTGTVIKPTLGTVQVNVASNTTSANQVHAYPFTTGAPNPGDTITVTRVNLGEGKSIIISECPGRVDQPVGGSSKCSVWGSESTLMPYVVTTGTSRSICALQPNTTYYLNVKNSRGPTSNPLSPPTCSTTCGYLIFKN